MTPRVRKLSRVAAGVVLAVTSLALLRAEVVETVTISSESMVPTLEQGDRVVLDKLSPKVRDLRRGELIVFCSPQDDRMVLKRLVGLGGDRVEIRDAVLFVNGAAVEESYVDLAAFDATYFGPVTVHDGQVFVLGDNRSNSIDSRTYGGVPLAEVVGRVLLSIG